MISVSHAISAVLIISMIFIVIDLLRKGLLREKHALWWLILGIFALLISFFPSLLEELASFLGVATPANLAFFVAILVLLLVSIQHAKDVSVLEEKTRALAESAAILELRVSRLEQPTHHG